MNTPKATPLHEWHKAHQGRLVDFAGWSMPVQYHSIMAEHEAVRTKVGLFEVSHMGRLEFQGELAMDLLQRATVNDVNLLGNNQIQYSLICDDLGGTIDDVLVYRMYSDRWAMVCNASNREAVLERLHELNKYLARIDDTTEQTAMIAIQGPEALGLIQRKIDPSADQIKYYHFKDFLHQGRPSRLSRTGYTGEKGVEIYAASDRIGPLWDDLLAAGVKPAGLGARDTLRLEAGLPLYGHELGEDVTPVEAGMERYAAKADAFAGREAVMRRLAAGPAKRLCGFRTAGRQAARAGHRVLVSGQDAGLVTSGSFSPTLQYAMGFAYVATPYATPGTKVTIDTGRAALDAELVRMPLYSAVK